MSSLRAAAVALVMLAACAPGLPELETSGRPVRPDQPDAPASDPHFFATETVESWVSPGGHVRVHFTRNGQNAVPALDADASGVPDYVELAGTSYDEVRAVDQGTLGLLEPLSDAILGAGDGGDDKFDVYLLDFGGRGDGTFRREACLPDRPSVCTGFMLQENDFAGYSYPSLQVASRILGSHEYFHAVQAAYDGDQDTVFSESTAVWATERFDPSLSDFEGFIGAYLGHTDRSLDVVSGGVVDAKSYGTAIFFQFLSEKFGDRAVTGLLEEVRDGQGGVSNPTWYERLDPFLVAGFDSSFSSAFAEFALWNLYTGRRANPARSYARGIGYPLVTTEPATLPFALGAPRFFPASIRYFESVPAGRTALTAALVLPADEASTLEPLRLFLAPVSRNVVAEPVPIADLGAGVTTADLTGADQVMVVVVNTAREGMSLRPDLCVGTPEEVSSCRAAALAERAAAGGSSDAGPSPDAGVSDDAGSEPAPEKGGCTCVSAQGYPVGVNLLLFAVLLRRRRR